jgi:K+-sensing histidine kinase KdpD
VSYWFLLTFAMGWVFGLAMMKIVRVVQENDLVGILADCISAWYQTHRAMHSLPSNRAIGTALGTAVCGFAAAAVCLLFHGNRYDALFPLGFVAVLLGCARLFGALAGTLGSIVAAFIFARLLYPPQGFAVADPVAQTTLALMVVTTSIASWLLAVSREHKRTRTVSSGRS